MRPYVRHMRPDLIHPRSHGRDLIARKANEVRLQLSQVRLDAGELPANCRLTASELQGELRAKWQ